MAIWHGGRGPKVGGPQGVGGFNIVYILIVVCLHYQPFLPFLLFSLDVPPPFAHDEGLPCS